LQTLESYKFSLHIYVEVLEVGAGKMVDAVGEFVLLLAVA